MPWRFGGHRRHEPVKELSCLFRQPLPSNPQRFVCRLTIPGAESEESRHSDGPWTTELKSPRATGVEEMECTFHVQKEPSRVSQMPRVFLLEQALLFKGSQDLLRVPHRSGFPVFHLEALGDELDIDEGAVTELRMVSSGIFSGKLALHSPTQPGHFIKPRFSSVEAMLVNERRDIGGEGRACTDQYARSHQGLSFPAFGSLFVIAREGTHRCDQCALAARWAEPGVDGVAGPFRIRTGKEVHELLGCFGTTSAFEGVLRVVNKEEVEV